MKIDENRQKLTCSKFFDKIKIFYFFWFFHKRCLNKSSVGSKNNQKKISRCFREICKFVFKKSKKKPTPDFGENFWKIYFFLIFWVFRRKYLETYSKRIRNRFAKIVSSLRDVSLKRKVSRPSIPPIPSFTLKNVENQKRSLLEGVSEIKKKVV